MCVGLASTSLVPLDTVVFFCGRLDTVVKSHIQKADKLEGIGGHLQPRWLRPVYGFNMCFLFFVDDKTISCQSLDSLSINWAMASIS